jgi:cysteinyl-tRNA synthetase
MPRMIEALDKDLNTPAALAIIGEVGKAANEIVVFTTKAKDPAKATAGRALAKAAHEALYVTCRMLGLLSVTPRAFFERTKAQRLGNRGLDPAVIEAKVVERSAARAAKDFARGDVLRKELIEMGVEVLDSPGGSTWKVTL